MPQVYTVATENAFAALDDNSDEEVILAQQPPKKDTAPPPAAPQREEPSSQDARQQRRQPARTNNGPRPTGGAPTNNTRPPRVTAPEDTTNFDASRTTTARRRPVVPKQEKINPVETRLDRHSGTGRGKEMKKDGGGGHNWGNQPGDFGAEDETAKQLEPEQVPTGDEKEEPKEKKEENVVLYAEYTKKRADEMAFVPKEAAPANSQVESGYQLYTKEVKNVVASKEVSHEKTQKKQTMPVPLRYQGNRQYSSGPQGGRRRNQQEGGASQQQQQPQQEPKPQQPSGQNQQGQPGDAGAIDLQDKLAFPTLEAH